MEQPGEIMEKCDISVVPSLFSSADSAQHDQLSRPESYDANAALKDLYKNVHDILRRSPSVGDGSKLMGLLPADHEMGKSNLFPNIRGNSMAPGGAETPGSLLAHLATPSSQPARPIGLRSFSNPPLKRRRLDDATPDYDYLRLTDLVHHPDFVEDVNIIREARELIQRIELRGEVRGHVSNFFRDVESAREIATDHTSSTFWTKETHPQAPRALRKAVMTMLMCQSHPLGPINKLSKGLVLHIASFLRHEDYHSDTGSLVSFVGSLYPQSHDRVENKTGESVMSRFIIRPVKARSLILYCHLNYRFDIASNQEEVDIKIESQISPLAAIGPAANLRFPPSMAETGTPVMQIKMAGPKGGRIDIMGHASDIDAFRKANDLDDTKWSVFRVIALLLVCGRMHNSSIKDRVLTMR